MVFSEVVMFNPIEVGDLVVSCCGIFTFNVNFTPLLI